MRDNERQWRSYINEVKANKAAASKSGTGYVPRKIKIQKEIAFWTLVTKWTVISLLAGLVAAFAWSVLGGLIA